MYNEKQLILWRSMGEWELCLNVLGKFLLQQR